MVDGGEAETPNMAVVREVQMYSWPETLVERGVTLSWLQLLLRYLDLIALAARDRSQTPKGYVGW